MHHSVGVSKKIPASGGGGRRGRGVLSPSLRRLSVSSVVSTGFLCRYVVSPVSPSPSVVRVPLAFSPAGYGRPFIAFGGGLPSGVRGTRPSYVASVPSVPPPLRRLPSVPSSVPTFLLRFELRPYGGKRGRHAAPSYSGQRGRHAAPAAFALPLIAFTRRSAATSGYRYGQRLRRLPSLSGFRRCRRGLCAAPACRRRPAPRLPPPPLAPCGVCMFHVEHSCSCNYSQL